MAVTVTARLTRLYWLGGILVCLRGCSIVLWWCWRNIRVSSTWVDNRFHDCYSNDWWTRHTGYLSRTKHNQKHGTGRKWNRSTEYNDVSTPIKQVLSRTWCYSMFSINSGKSNNTPMMGPSLCIDCELVTRPEQSWYTSLTQPYVHFHCTRISSPIQLHETTVTLLHKLCHKLLHRSEGNGKKTAIN